MDRAAPLDGTSAAVNTRSDSDTRTARTASASRRRWLRVLLVGLGVAVLGGLAFWYVVIPYPWRLEGGEPVRTALMRQRAEEAADAGAGFEVRQTWVPLEQISPNVVRAVVVAEDYRFRQHGGVDWLSLGEEVQWTGDEDFSWTSLSDLRALYASIRYGWEHRTELKGRSTITQQLAKNLYFGTERSFVRKAYELVVAKRLERRLGKDAILELYLNSAEWGPGIFGVEAAARTYFGVSASDLTLDEAAELAATLPQPLSSNPSTNPGRMLWRKDLILDRIDPLHGLPAPPEPILLPDLGLDV
jgi:monofunctional biosynthetic peptidoglycan transglycosylase